MEMENQKATIPQLLAACCIAGIMFVMALGIVFFLIDHAFNGVWWTQEGLYVVTFSEEAGVCETEPEMRDEEGFLIQHESEMCERVTFFRDIWGITRGVTVTETSSITDNVYRSDYAVVESLELCDKDPFCFARGSKKEKVQLDQLAAYRGQVAAGSTPF